jgi:hypothetical protein
MYSTLVVGMAVAIVISDVDDDAVDTIDDADDVVDGD